jgi:hypothetical protein
MALFLRMHLSASNRKRLIRRRTLDRIVGFRPARREAVPKSLWGKSDSTECGPTPRVLEARLNEALAADAFACPVSAVCSEWIRLVHKEITYDPPSQNDARRRRNYAQTTIDCYIQTIEDFARYFRRPPDQLTPEHIREYQAYLFRERKLAASTVTQRLAALRFFYTQTIRKAWSVADTPYPKKTRPLPSILSQEEVAHLIDCSQTRFHRMVLMTLYGTGVRRAELARLQISDIDSRRSERRRCCWWRATCMPIRPRD